MTCTYKIMNALWNFGEFGSNYAFRSHPPPPAGSRRIKHDETYWAMSFPHAAKKNPTCAHATTATTPAYSTGLPLIFRSHKTPRADFYVSRISAEVMTRGVHLWPRLAGAARFTHVLSAKVGATAIEACLVYAKHKFKSLEFKGAVLVCFRHMRRPWKRDRYLLTQLCSHGEVFMSRQNSFGVLFLVHNVVFAFQPVTTKKIQNYSDSIPSS